MDHILRVHFGKPLAPGLGCEQGAVEIVKFPPILLPTGFVAWLLQSGDQAGSGGRGFGSTLRGMGGRLSNHALYLSPTVGKSDMESSGKVFVEMGAFTAINLVRQRWSLWGVHFGTLFR